MSNGRNDLFLLFSCSITYYGKFIKVHVLNKYFYFICLRFYFIKNTSLEKSGLITQHIIDKKNVLTN